MPGFTVLRERYVPASYSDANFLQIAQGPVRLSEETVMTVESHMVGSSEPVEAYWRGKVFDRYNGHGWQVSEVYRRQKPVSVIGRNQLQREVRRFGESKPRKGLLEQRLRMGPGQGNSVYGAAEPVIVETPARFLERNSFGSWQSARQRFGPMDYTVYSVLPVSDAEKLRRAGTNYAEEIRRTFLQRSVSSVKVGRLARKVTAGARTPYDKAARIERYLGTRCIYDLNAPPAPLGQDAVEYFLFDSQIGYCDVFASAMVVMCREVGVPSRLATGFAPGSYDSGVRVFCVRDMDRHAWAEVWFPGCGWVTFDPTAYTSSSPESWAARAGRNIRRVARELFGGPVAVPIAVVLFTACIVAAFGADLKSVRSAIGSGGANRTQAAAMARYAAIRRLLRIEEDYLTPIESVVAAGLRSDETKRIADEATRFFSQVRYGSRPVTKEDVRELDRLIRKLKSAVRSTHQEAREL